jgi:hypothetical protein
MKADQLFRFAGLAALLGGLARIVTAFDLGLAPPEAEILYTAIDILLLFGLMGIYLVRAEQVRFLGLVSFIVAVSAFSLIGGPDADPWGFSTYQEGATVLAFAMAGLSLAWVQTRAGPRVPPLLWFASLIAGGAASYLPALPGFAIAGALFGAAFACAGWELVRRPA